VNRDQHYGRSTPKKFILFLFLDDDPWSHHQHQALRGAGDTNIFKEPVHSRGFSRALARRIHFGPLASA
jgi:hypothetical protein